MLVKHISQHKQTQNNPEVKVHNVKHLSMNKGVYLLVPSGRVRNRGTSSTEGPTVGESSQHTEAP